MIKRRENFKKKRMEDSLGRAVGVFLSFTIRSIFTAPSQLILHPRNVLFRMCVISFYFDDGSQAERDENVQLRAYYKGC